MNNKIKQKITFLGTGTSTGVPVIGCDCPVCMSDDFRDQRLRTSAVIETDDKVLVIDTGPDFRQQMLASKVGYIDAVLLTHSHRDHIAGLDDIRAFNYVHNKVIDFYGSEETIIEVKKCFPYLGSGRFFGAPQVELHIVENKEFIVQDIPIIPIKMLHDKMEVFGFRVHDITYITDANFISEEEIKKIEGSKIIVINALRKSRHVSHFSLQEAVDIIERFKPEKAFITHTSHFIGLHAEVNDSLPSYIRMAYDGLEVEV